MLSEIKRKALVYGDLHITSIKSNFARETISLLLRRYTFFYHKEGNCIEYFVTDKYTREEISYALVLSLNTYSHHINVSRFCPELYKEIASKYLSAACFYLLIHHFAYVYHLPKEYGISLSTRPATYEKFFSRLKDFHLLIKGLKLCETVGVFGTYPQLDIDTSMITEKP